MTLTRKQKIKFYKSQPKIKKVILKNAQRKKHIVFGARASNAIFPQFLDRPTEDFDVYSETPKKTARRVEKKLDKKFGGDFFLMRPAAHPGTFKVVSKVTKRGVADYSKPDRKITHKTIAGVRYAKLIHQKENIAKSLADPASKFRHDKDRETLERIRIFEEQRKKKRQSRRLQAPRVPLLRIPNLSGGRRIL